MKFNYRQICSDLLKSLSERQKIILSRRFALNANKRESLESIGKDLGITRERVRQIEKDGLAKLKTAAEKYRDLFCHFDRYFTGQGGGLKKEEIALRELGGEKEQNHVLFLLNLDKKFERFGETSEFYSFWTNNKKVFAEVKKVINLIREKLEKNSRPVSLKELQKEISFNPSFLEISKKIQKNSEGFFGLRDWPEINPRGVKDKAFLAFKKEQRPLHFTQVARFIDSVFSTSTREEEEKKYSSALPQTVHNELIKDPRFVLVGRGIYALKEWGYEPGMVKDVILKILKETKKPLSREEILEKTLKQRMVKENTVFLNLSNKKYFSKTKDGKYRIQES